MIKRIIYTVLGPASLVATAWIAGLDIAARGPNQALIFSMAVIFASMIWLLDW